MIKDDLIYFNYIKIHCYSLQPFFPRQHYPELQKEIKKNGQIGGLSEAQLQLQLLKKSLLVNSTFISDILHTFPCVSNS